MQESSARAFVAANASELNPPAVRLGRSPNRALQAVKDPFRGIPWEGHDFQGVRKN